MSFLAQGAAMSNHDDAQAKPTSDSTERARQRAKEHTIAGGALGAASLGSLAVFGTFACPLCVVAAPALVCSGLWNARKARRACSDDDLQEMQDGTNGVPDKICFEPSNH